MTGFLIDEDGNVRAADPADAHQRLADANAILLRQLRVEQARRKQLEGEIRSFLRDGDRQRLQRTIDSSDDPTEPEDDHPAG